MVQQLRLFHVQKYAQDSTKKRGLSLFAPVLRTFRSDTVSLSSGTMMVVSRGYLPLMGLMVFSCSSVLGNAAAALAAAGKGASGRSLDTFEFRHLL
jgi:hypothetical protein